MLTKPAVLTTERLVLRAFEAKDLPQAAALLRHPEVSRTYMLPDLSDDAQLRRLFDRLCALSRAEDRFVYAISLNGNLIGLLNDTAIEGELIEVGYALHPDHWNCGYATEALRAAIGAAFAMGYSHVRAGYFADNPASGRVMSKCGMQPLPLTEEVEYRGMAHTCRFCQADKG